MERVVRPVARSGLSARKYRHRSSRRCPSPPRRSGLWSLCSRCDYRGSRCRHRVDVPLGRLRFQYDAGFVRVWTIQQAIQCWSYPETYARSRTTDMHNDVQLSGETGPICADIAACSRFRVGSTTATSTRSCRRRCDGCPWCSRGIYALAGLVSTAASAAFGSFN